MLSIAKKSKQSVLCSSVTRIRNRGKEVECQTENIGSLNNSQKTLPIWTISVDFEILFVIQQSPWIRHCNKIGTLLYRVLNKNYQMCLKCFNVLLCSICFINFNSISGIAWISKQVPVKNKTKNGQTIYCATDSKAFLL